MFTLSLYPSLPLYKFNHLNSHIVFLFFLKYEYLATFRVFVWHNFTIYFCAITFLLHFSILFAWTSFLLDLGIAW